MKRATPTGGSERPLKVWLPAVRAGSGADVFTQRLGDALVRRGVDARISWFAHWSEIVPDVLRSREAPAGTDIIHANSTYAFAFARRNLPLVLTEHHYILDPVFRPYKSVAQHLYHRLLMGPYMRRSYARADAITTDSRFTAAVLGRILGIQATRTIPLWADYDVFSPDPGPPDDDATRPFRLLFVGNASRRKGADVVLELARRLQRGFEVRCTSGLRRQMQGELPENVRILGRLSERQLVDEYRQCDAVLVPSRYEGFGYSALEAMACAKPVVGFRCGAIEEVVEHDETGLLRPLDDVEGLEADCRSLAADRRRARQMGQAGRLRATRAFSETKAIDAYLDLYRTLADAAKRGARHDG